MPGSPIDQLLEALDKLDVDLVMALFEPDAHMMTADGRTAEGSEAMRRLLSAFLAQLRSTTHRVTAQWHEEDVWIAEVEAEYELADWMRMGPLPRAFFVREGSRGLSDMRVYGAHEHQLADHGDGGGLRVGGRWMPPL